MIGCSTTPTPHLTTTPIEKNTNLVPSVENPKPHPWAPSKNPLFFQGKRIVILPMNLKIYHITADEAPTVNQNWTTTAKANFQNAFKQYFARHGVPTVQFLNKETLSDSQQTNLQETFALFSSFPLENFKHGKEHFRLKISDFSVGEEISNLSPSSELFVIVNGHSPVFSTGRIVRDIAIMTLGVAALGSSIIAPGAAPNLGPIKMDLGTTQDRNPYNNISIGFINALSGELIWCNQEVVEGGIDFRDPKHMEEYLDFLLRWIGF